MTDREKAIVMAYTGIAMLTGDKINTFYEYLSELYHRPVYTHEIPFLDIKERAKQDFLELCKDDNDDERFKKKVEIVIRQLREDNERLNKLIEERKKGRWEWVQYESKPNFGNWHCSICRAISKRRTNYCPNCGAEMEGSETE